MKKSMHLLVGLLAILSVVGCQNKKVPGSSSSSSGLRSVYYDYDQALVRSDSAVILESNSAWLKANPGRNVSVEGHCDERGSNEYNLALGQRRADSSRDYLTNLGVNPSNLRTVSFGEEKPVCYEHDESCWWKNRRADFRSY